MPKVTYIEYNGETKEIDVPAGDSVMQGAVNNLVEGIIGECGGSCICATCHCYVDEAWRDKVGPPGDAEEDMLSLDANRRENSRLGCQIKITEELDGLIVRLPESQH